MDLVDHFRVIARHWFVILLVSCVVGGAVYFLSGRRPNVYRAETVLNVLVGRSGDSGAVPAQTAFLTGAYVELTFTRPVLEDAAERSGLPISADEVLDRISVTPSGSIGFLTISATGPTPQYASKVANSAAAALIDKIAAQQVRQIDSDLAQVNAELAAFAGELAAVAPDAPEREEIQARYSALLQAAVDRRTQPRDRAEVLSSASPPRDPSSPQPVKEGMLGFLVALALTAESIVVRKVLSDRLSKEMNTERLGASLGFPVLAGIPKGNADSDEVVEAFHRLRTSLLTLRSQRSIHSILVTSATAGAGKSFTAINLAQSLTANMAQVLLVDADLRRPVLHERLVVPRAPGLSEVLGGASPIGAVYSVGLPDHYAVKGSPRFLLLPGGNAVHDPGAAFGIDRVATIPELLAEQLGEQHADFLVVDSPPIALFADAMLLSAQCDATVLVIDAKKNRLVEIEDTIKSLERSGANVVGMVLNRTAVSRAAKYYHYA